MNSRFRRGFKKEAECYAHEFREELGLLTSGPLCPFELALHLAIPVQPMTFFHGRCAEVIAHFRASGRSEFSAVTVLDGYRRLIIHNDSHHPNRQRSNVAHELGHAVLGHPASPPLNDTGNRYYDSLIEREADFLGMALLVSRDASIKIVFADTSIEETAEDFGVSLDLLNYRLGITGAKKIRERSERKYRGH